MPAMSDVFPLSPPNVWYDMGEIGFSNIELCHAPTIYKEEEEQVKEEEEEMEEEEEEEEEKEKEEDFTYRLIRFTNTHLKIRVFWKMVVPAAGELFPVLILYEASTCALSHPLGPPHRTKTPMTPKGTQLRCCNGRA